MRPRLDLSFRCHNGNDFSGQHRLCSAVSAHEFWVRFQDSIIQRIVR